jgi:hypothetical protein
MWITAGAAQAVLMKPRQVGTAGQASPPGTLVCTWGQDRTPVQIKRAMPVRSLASTAAVSRRRRGAITKAASFTPTPGGHAVRAGKAKVVTRRPDRANILRARRGDLKGENPADLLLCTIAGPCQTPRRKAAWPHRDESPDDLGACRLRGLQMRRRRPPEIKYCGDGRAGRAPRRSKKDVARCDR